MTERPLLVTTVAHARAGLSGSLRRFRADPDGAQPVVLGSHRRPEAVILPYSRYEQIVFAPLLTQAETAENTENGQSGPAKPGEFRELPELLAGVSRDDLAERWLNAILSAVEAGTEIVDRGRIAFRSDAALPLACEALIARVGELARLLIHLDAARFHDPMWTLAAHNQKFVVHHDNRIDEHSIWMLVTEGFPELAEVAETARRPFESAAS